jgi:hypothetical protein
LLKEDKDFGQLVFAYGSDTSGVILFRVQFSARTWLLENFGDIVSRYGDRLSQSFTVIEPHRVRIAERPAPESL